MHELEGVFYVIQVYTVHVLTVSTSDICRYLLGRRELNDTKNLNARVL